MRLALDSAQLFPRLFGQARPLSESIEHIGGQPVPKYKWIHVASEGMYRGHWQGAFNLTRDTFDAFVRNLHQHPQFRQGTLKLGAEEITCGVRDVIQFDYEHASEMMATEGSIPSMGAPAPAWVCDVEVRDAPDGTAQLWALANLGTQIRGQIERNEYRFVSIAFDLEHADWKSAEDQGPTLTSIAFTNHPFLQDLESYAAANRRPGQLRGDRLQPTASGNEAPVDTPQSGKGSDMNAGANADLERFRTQICSALAIRTTLADQAVVDAATEAVATGGGLKAILEGLGVKDAGNALKVIPELMAARSKLAETMAELDQLLQGQAAQDGAMAANDVAAVMSSKRWTDEGLKRPLLADRNARMDAAEAEVNRKAALSTGNPSAKAPATERIKARADARAEFLKDNGVGTTPGVDTSHLTTSIAATKGGVQLTVVTPQPRVLAADPADTDGGGEVVDLRGVAGANPFEKVITYLNGKDPSFSKLSHFQRCSRASAFQAANQFLT
jgi:hypothetical protein